MEDQKEKPTQKDEGLLQDCQKERDEWKDRAMRATADFVNYKKRVEKDQSNWRVNAQMVILADLLSIIDDFDRALAEQEKKERTTELDAWLTGFELIHNKLSKLLEKYNVTEISQVTTFDPQLHEALVHLESKDHESGAVIEVLQKGYLIKDQVLRPAKVSVAK